MRNDVDDARTGLRGILEAVAREASDLALMAAGLQAVLPAPQAGICARTVESLQALDLLTQRLHGIGDFLGTLAPTLPEGWRADAASAAAGLSLSGMARRLAGAAAEGSDEAEAFELFEADGV